LDVLFIRHLVNLASLYYLLMESKLHTMVHQLTNKEWLSFIVCLYVKG